MEKITANQLFYGDNLEVLRKKIADETVDLCYIDPPFNSKRNYNQIYNNQGEEDKAQAQAFVDTWRWDDRAQKGFEEIMEDRQRRFTNQTILLISGLNEMLGKGSMLAYIVSMTLRLQEIHRVLKPTGSLYVHCDATMSHYLKLALDAIFCPRGGEFRNEIIWCYRGGGSSKTDFGRRHDSIFRYTKSNQWKFNADAIRVTYESAAAGRTGDSAWGKHQGTDKVYHPHPLGKIPEDWWDIAPINSQAKERLGYATQKPEALLERIILASSNKGDVVLDAFCGCGTTVAVAEQLGRKWMGIDITYQSISTILARLEKAHGRKFIDKLTLSGIPRDKASAVALAHKKDDRLRKEFEKWAVLTYSNDRARINDAKGADQGIDGFVLLHNGKKPAKVIFSVKSGHVGVAQIRDLRGALEREKAIAARFITVEEPTRDMLAEATAAGSARLDTIADDFPKIRIVTLEQLLAGERIDLPLILDPHK